MADISNTTSDVTLYDENGNPVKIIFDGGEYKLVVYNPDIANGTQKVIIWDGVDTVNVTDTGRLQVDTGTPTPPSGTTAVNIEILGSVLSSADTTYTIPNGEELHLTRFIAGASADEKTGNVIELWYDPLGTGLGMTLIDAIFAWGTSDQHDLSDTFTGDGTAKIRLRRRRLGGGSREIHGAWDGYY